MLDNLNIYKHLTIIIIVSRQNCTFNGCGVIHNFLSSCPLKQVNCKSNEKYLLELIFCPQI